MSAFSEIDIQLQTAPTLCDDCDVILHPGNVTVNYDAAFWANAKWSDETHCSSCKAQREADGPSDLDMPTYGFEPAGYREAMVGAGRGHLL